MDITWGTPVFTAIATVLPQIGFNSIEQTSIAAGNNIYINAGVSVNVSVIGSIKGSILISSTLDGAMQFASKMMMGMPVTELDGMAQSALSEMGNMVCAYACTVFSEHGMPGLDVSPPTILIGEGATIMVPAPQTLTASFTVDAIPLRVCVGLT
ncbi:chemotaxis protein CheX [Heliophilum fasciatum]|uniref:Chemotaxis protein CheX n=1 Tax=Heliophilum fasciatum TaxID=35700 RepID=A0A4R2RZV5_9FIRM|nr:chemotaxis protein CheX [Heliophilum fasciatum]MCW2276870.1 chemotaxis protein CheX [Heliophilum fasciatum]TCP68669.1 chemotaxis protein CheX [Heliophilum fasciatum]